MSQDDIYQIADELRAIASLGLQFSETSYDKERYEKTLALSARLLASLEHRTPNEVLDEYRGNLAHVSPLLGADAAVFRDDQLLLIKRADDGLWAMPGGLVDIGETWAEAALRELREETGVQGTVAQLLGLFDGRLWGSKWRFHLYLAVFEIQANTADPVSGPETSDVGFFSANALPDLSAGHHLRIPFIFKIREAAVPVPYWDPPDR